MLPIPNSLLEEQASFPLSLINDGFSVDALPPRWASSVHVPWRACRSSRCGGHGSFLLSRQPPFLLLAEPTYPSRSYLRRTKAKVCCSMLIRHGRLNSPQSFGSPRRRSTSLYVCRSIPPSTITEIFRARWVISECTFLEYL